MIHGVPTQVLRVTVRGIFRISFTRWIKALKLKKCVLVSFCKRIFELWVTGALKREENVLRSKFWGLQGLLTAMPLSCSSLFIELTKEVQKPLLISKINNTKHKFTRKQKKWVTLRTRTTTVSLWEAVTLKTCLIAEIFD